MARFHTLDVFTDRPFGGNPLAVLPDAQAVPESAMQKIAREFNLSETVFVFPPKNERALRRLRIFTPARELPFAGHPTVGTAHLLWELGLAPPPTDGRLEFVFEEEIGLVPIRIDLRENAAPFVQLTSAVLPERGPAPPAREALAAALSLDPEDLAGEDDRPEAYSCGMPYVFVPLRSREALARATPDLARWREVLDPYWATQAYLFCREPANAEAHFRARMFAPTLGVFEDPATGSAAAAMSGFLAPRLPQEDGVQRVVLVQGIEMGRPSRLTLEMERRNGQLAVVRVGGAAVRVSEGELLVST